MKFLEHITIEGDRWDSLSQRYYGNPLAYVGLVEANSRYAHLPNLTSGLKLKIPIINEPVKQRKVPPWRKK